MIGRSTWCPIVSTTTWSAFIARTDIAVRFPSWKVLCSGSIGNSVPLLTNTALPNIGKNFGLRIEQARANSAVTFCFGVSNSQWGALVLPFDLRIIGAPGCSIYAGCSIPIGGFTNVSGVATMSALVPNLSVFVGAQFYNQAVVADPGANSAGLALSRAGAGKVGSQ